MYTKYIFVFTFFLSLVLSVCDFPGLGGAGWGGVCGGGGGGVPDQQFGGPGAVRKMSPCPTPIKKIAVLSETDFFTGGVNS